MAFAFGTVDPLAAVIATVGVVLAVPGAILAYRELRNSRSGERDRHSPRWRAMTAALLALGVAGIGVGIWLISQAPVSCEDSDRVRIEKSVSGGEAAPVIVTVICPPESGHRYLFIKEVPPSVVDSKNPHPEYYIASEFADGNTKAQRLEVHFHDYPVGTILTLYALDVDADAAAWVQANMQAGYYLLSLPPRAQPASSRVFARRDWK